MAKEILHWHDREMLEEFRRLMEADCLTLTVIRGRDVTKDRDATHCLPRLLELAGIALEAAPDA